MALRIIQDMGASLLIEKDDGTQIVVPRATYESLMGQEVPMETPSIADLPIIAPTTEPILPTEPSLLEASTIAPPPISGELAGGPLALRQEEISISPEPILEEPPKPLEVELPPVPVVPEEPPISGEPPTREEERIGIRERQAESIRAREELTEVEREEAAELLAIKEEKVKVLAEKDVQYQEDIEEAQAKTVRLTEERTKRADDYRKAEVNPDRWWDSKSTAGKIMSGIGVALAGLGMAMKGRGGENPGLDIINNAIEQDLQLQLKKIERMGKDVEHAKGILADQLKLTGNIDSAYASATKIARDSYADRIDQASAQSKNESVRIEGAQAAIQLRADAAADLRKSVDAEIAAEYAEKAQRRAEAALGLQRRGMRLREKQFDYAKEQKELDRQLKAGEAPGFGTYQDPATGEIVGNYAHDDKEANRAHGKLAVGRTQMGKDINALKKMAVKCKVSYGGPLSDDFLATKCGKTMDIRYGLMITKWKNAISGAAVGEEESKRLENIMPGKETLTSADPSIAWDEILLRLSEEEIGNDNSSLLGGANEERIRSKYITPTSKEEFEKYLTSEALSKIAQKEAPPGVDSEVNHRERLAAVDEFFEYSETEEASTEQVKVLNDLALEQMKSTRELYSIKVTAMKEAGISITGVSKKDAAAILKAKKDGKITDEEADSLLKLNEKHRQEALVTARIASNYKRIKPFVKGTLIKQIKRQEKKKRKKQEESESKIGSLLKGWKGK